MLVLAVATSMAVGACSGGDKAGGSGEVVVLTMANTSSHMDHQPAVEHFAGRVAKLSGGELRVEPKNEWGNFEADAEKQVVGAVAAGEVDLGWVGARVFDTLDVTSFQAVTAPMLVDSYELQDAVIRSEITREMLRGIEPAGVVGLGVVPDALRKPIGVEGPLVNLSDWRGTTFGTFPSKSQSRSSCFRTGSAASLKAFTMRARRSSWSTALRYSGLSQSIGSFVIRGSLSRAASRAV